MRNHVLTWTESISTTNTPYFLIVIYLSVLIYCCFGLAIICNVHFVPALQKLSTIYDIPPDIVGSTLMAVGGSVPSLCASLIGVFITEDDIGTGSVIGSSCFNLVAVPATCAFVAVATFPTRIKLQSVPVIRNSAFYAISMITLVLVTKDNKVDITESIVLLTLFVMYILFMIYWVKTQLRGRSFQVASDGAGTVDIDSGITDSYESNDSSFITGDDVKCSVDQKEIVQVVCLNVEANSSNLVPDIIDFSSKNISNRKLLDERTPLTSDSSINESNYLRNSYLTMTQKKHHIESRTSNHNLGYDLVTSDDEKLRRNDARELDRVITLVHSSDPIIQNSMETNNVIMNIHHPHDEAHMIDNEPREVTSESQNPDRKWISSRWVLIPMLPLTLSMRFLMPYELKSTFWTIWTFLISIALIGMLTYVSVYVVQSLGEILSIPEEIAGFTILSWGNGVPEMITSIVLIRKTAQADMALSNTIGSNIIDATFSLSLPWIVKCLINESYGLEPVVYIQTNSLPWTIILLLVSVILLLIILKLHDWSLCLSVGIWLTLVYVTFVVSAIFLEYIMANGDVDWTLNGGFSLSKIELKN